MRLTAERYLSTRLGPLWERLRGSEATTGILLAALVGGLTGLGAVAFRKVLIDGFGWIFFDRGAVVLDFLGDNYVVILPIVGALLFGPLIYFLCREAKGHGVPEVMEAVAIGGGRIRPRVAAIKALASSICIASGGSVGREGPIVQIGASIGSTVGQWFRLPEEWIRTLLLCGAAGGISATFNAPIGGVLFALEVLQRRFVPGNFASLVIASVTADVVAQNFLGEEPSFLIPTPAYTMASNWEILPYILLGIVAALTAFVFVRLFYKTENLFGDLRFPGYLKPALGGIIIGLIGMYYFDILGVGYGAGYGLGGVQTDVGGVDRALFGDLAVGTLLIYLVMKMIATSATLGTGGSGGIFAPSLFIGSMLGGAFGIAVYKLFPGITAASAAEASGAYALVGMGAFFAATAHAPMTAIVMLFEMTRDYALILPLMLTVVISALVSRNLNRESIYTLKLVRRGVDIDRREVADVLGRIKVTDIMTRNFPTVRTSMPVSKVMEKLHRSGHHGFPVLDESGAFYGIVALEDVESAMSRHDLATLTAGDIANRSPIVAHPGQSIHDALTQLGGRDVGRIPVVARDDPKKLLGVLRRHDIVSAYTKTLGNRGVK